jgi:hypothetical protein
VFFLEASPQNRIHADKSLGLPKVLVTNMAKFFIKVFSFSKETLKLILMNPKHVNVMDLAKHFPAWWSSLDNNKMPLTEEQPWIAFAAIHFLKKVLRKDMRVYEYGSGGSTLFFAARVQEVISAEHDKDWHAKVQGELNKKRIHNCQLRLFEPVPALTSLNQDISDPNAYISSGDNYRGKSFEAYASSINGYPDDFFDIVLIDGRSRPSCFKHAKKKVKRGGYLILDNAETRHYSYIHNTLSNQEWIKYDFFGLFPYLYHFSETCIWQKVDTDRINLG